MYRIYFWCYEKLQATVEWGFPGVQISPGVDYQSQVYVRGGPDVLHGCRWRHNYLRHPRKRASAKIEGSRGEGNFYFYKHCNLQYEFKSLLIYAEQSRTCVNLYKLVLIIFTYIKYFLVN